MKPETLGLSLIFALAIQGGCGAPPVGHRSAAIADGRYPDLRTVVPQHVQLANDRGREILRFSNGIANTGAGPLQLRPLNVGATTYGIQQILDASGGIVSEFVASVYELHPEHNHWHISDVAGYEVRAGDLTGPVYGAASVKTTFCLIDWYRLEGNSRRPDRVYWDCQVGLQGISPGWVDQYHHSLPGQSVDLTGAPPGTYYLISTANPDGNFGESDHGNNSAWVRFVLSRNGGGNARIEITGHSPCADPGLCGEFAPNR